MAERGPLIVDITSVPKSRIASLHLQYLPSLFSRVPGSRLLELYYDALSRTDDAFGFAAVFEGNAVGFACAVRSLNSIQRLMLMRQPGKLVFWYGAQLAYRPSMAIDLAKRIRARNVNVKDWERPTEWSEWYTYRPLVVDEAYRTYQLADLLTKRLVEETKRRGAPGIFGMVERENWGSRVTHVRNGFREVWKGEKHSIFAKEFK